MKNTTLICFCLLFYVIPAIAQKRVVEPGSPDELKGVTKIHVAADSETARKAIIETIKHSLPQLTIADKAEDAQAWLVFRIDRRSFPKAQPASGLASTAILQTNEEYESIATGQVIKPITKETFHRLIDFKDSTSSLMLDNLSKEFASAFVKAYKKTNIH
jgi:hypothetical protein